MIVISINSPNMIVFTHPLYTAGLLSPIAAKAEVIGWVNGFFVNACSIG